MEAKTCTQPNRANVMKGSETADAATTCRRRRRRRRRWVLVTFLAVVFFFSYRNLTSLLKAQQQRQQEESTFPASAATGKIQRISRPSSSRRISYKLHRENTFNNTYNLYYRCDNNRKIHPDMQPILNFTTTVTTDLKLLFMGDSVSVQNAQGFQEAAGADSSQRAVLRYSWGTHEGLFVAPVVSSSSSDSSSTSSGGGVVAGWRITDLLRRSRENKPLPNQGGGGWVRSDADAIKSYNYTLPNAKEEPVVRIGSFDTIIYRIPHGWMSLKTITKEGLQETVELAHELFGVQNVIFFSLPFVSNVMTRDDLTLLHQTNQMIREYVDSYNGNSNNNNNNHTTTTTSSGVDNVLLLDFGRLGDLLTEWNARLIGYNNTTISSSDYLFERLQCCPRRGFQRAIAEVCAERVQPGSNDCVQNAFSLDGLHWCSETMNGRINAGVSCLLECLYPDEDDVKEEDSSSLQLCEKECNDRFMSLRPIDRT